MIKPMKVSPCGVAVLHHYEQCRLDAYPDPATGGAPWTIGWGHTGADVHPGLVWTQALADAVFLEDLQRFEREVNSLVHVPLTQGRFDALVSFAYNVGSDIDADDKAEGLGDSTLLRAVNGGLWVKAAGQFPLWNKGNGKVMRGLTRRRYSEQALFNGHDGAEAIHIGIEAA